MLTSLWTFGVAVSYLALQACISFSKVSLFLLCSRKNAVAHVKIPIEKRSKNAAQLETQ